MAKRVMCVETQEVFESVTKASKWCDAPTTNISAVCKGKRRTAKGYHWEYVEDAPVIEPVEQDTDDLVIDELEIATLLDIFIISSPDNAKSGLATLTFSKAFSSKQFSLRL